MQLSVNELSFLNKYFIYDMKIAKLARLKKEYRICSGLTFVLKILVNNKRKNIEMSSYDFNRIIFYDDENICQKSLDKLTSLKIKSHHLGKMEPLQETPKIRAVSSVL